MNRPFFKYTRDISVKEWEEIINQILIPTDLAILKKKKEKIVKEIASLRKETSKIRREIDEVVFKLYKIDERDKAAICE